MRAALKWRWHPSQVGALTLREWCLFTDTLDAIVDDRKKQQSNRGRRRGK